MLAAIAVPAFAFVLLIWAYIATRLRLRKPYCHDCGADLGPDDTEICPECGRPLAGSDEEDEVPLDDSEAA